MNPIFLTNLIENSAKQKSPQFPHGFTYLSAEDAVQHGHELHHEGMIVVGNRQPDGSFPVMPTDTAVKWHAESGAVAHHEPAQRQSFDVEIEDNVPIPEGKRFGRGSSAEGTQVDKFPFNTLQVQQSFFLPQDNPPKVDEKGKVVPKHRAFSSVVSQANAKLHPKNFIIREDTKNGVAGARIYRMQDMTGPRPVRERKKKSPNVADAMFPQSYGQAAPQPNPAQSFGGSPFPAPAQGGGFGDPGFAAPQGGFGDPGFGSGPIPTAEAPSPFGGGFGGGFGPGAQGGLPDPE